MMKTLGNLILFIWSKFKITSNLTTENLALRQQLAVMKRTNRRPKIRMTDRLYWVFLSRFWRPWCTSFVIVKPDTVVRWHRKGIKLFWKFKSKGPGKPKMDHEIRHLVRKMAIANPSWGAQDSWGIAQAGFQCFRKNHIQPDASASAGFKAVSDLADFPEKPSEQLFDCFFHCSDSRLQHSVCSAGPQPQPSQSSPFQHNLKPDRRMDNPPSRGSLSLGYGAKIFNAGSGLDLWRFLSQSSEKHGYQRSGLGPAQPLAKPVYWADDRLDQARMYRPCHRLERSSSKKHSLFVFRILS